MDFSKIKEEMMQKKVWAVVGASANKERYGYKIWKILQKHGYEVYGINPNYDEIEGKKIYHNLKDLPKNVDVVDMVVGPSLALDVLDEAKELDIEYIFFQPGSYNEEVVLKSKDLRFKYLIKDCVYATLKRKEENDRIG